MSIYQTLFFRYTENRTCSSTLFLKKSAMEHNIKTLFQATDHAPLKKLIESHVKALILKENHLIVYVDNQAPLHELEEKSMDEHLRKALEKMYDPNITYELKLHNAGGTHEREKAVPHVIH